MEQEIRINRRVVNGNYDEKKIQEIVAYARSLNERIVAFDKRTTRKCVAIKK